MSWIERSWPTASGVSVSGNVTVSRSGRTGSWSGIDGAPIATVFAPSPSASMSMRHGSPSPLALRRRPGSIGTACGSAGSAIGSSTTSMPSS